MRKIRIKKDISCVWRILTNGQATDLAGRDLCLRLIDPKGKHTELTFEPDGNAAKFRVPHGLQKFVGVYALEMWENVDGTSQTVADLPQAFELVHLSTEETNGTASDIAAAEADLGSASLAVGVKGDKGDKGDQGDPGSDANVTEENIILALGYTPADNADLEDFQTELAGCVKNGENSGDIDVSADNIYFNGTTDYYFGIEQNRFVVDADGIELASAAGGATLNDKPIATTDQIPDVSGKADKTYVDTQLAGKASTTAVNEISSELSDVEAKINSKADSIIIGDLRDLDTEAHGSLVEAINEVYGYAFEEDGHVYGVRHYFNQSSPILTRFQTSQLHDLHQLLPVQSLMRRCILKDDGEVAYYLDHSDSTKKENGDDAVLDGTDGMVMVEIPTHYRKHTLVENADDPSLSYYETAISLLPFSGAFKVNKCYISAYEATIDRTQNKLASVVNTTARYRGGNNNADWDGTNKSLLGLPASVQSLTSFRNLARARGSEWNCQEYDIYTALYWLYTIEYANLNCQAAFNATRDGSGRHQGGLDDGVTNMPDWGGHNSYYPIIPCGVTNQLGNATGVVTYNVMKADGETIHYAAKVPSYRGVETPFGHIWKWTDGFLAIGNGTTQEYYICHDRSKYESTKNANYVSKGQSAGANGYIKEFLRNAEGDILTKSVGGGSTTYGCDYHYDAFANGTTYGLLLGGYANYGALAGLACTYSYSAPSGKGANIGSRLCWSLHSKIVE